MRPHANACPACEREHSFHTKRCLSCSTCLPGYIEPGRLLEIAANRHGGGDPITRDATCKALEDEPALILELLAE
jgi:hypothetical protein